MNTRSKCRFIWRKCRPIELSACNGFGPDAGYGPQRGGRSGPPEAGRGPGLAADLLPGGSGGVRTLREADPDVPLMVAALDRQLNARGFILPGLGDAGDRQFGTV